MIDHRQQRGHAHAGRPAGCRREARLGVVLDVLESSCASRIGEMNRLHQAAADVRRAGALADGAEGADHRQPVTGSKPPWRNGSRDGGGGWISLTQPLAMLLEWTCCNGPPGSRSRQKPLARK